MANVAHSTLTGSDLHEVKGASTATSGQVPIANGSGGAPFGKLTHTSLGTTGNSFGAQLFHVRDEKPSGTAGGATTSSTWTARTLNTSVTNEISAASLASNQITLPAGTYFIEARAPCYNSLHKAKLKNVTDASDTIIGSSASGPTSFGGVSDSTIQGRFTIAGTKIFEIQQYVINPGSSDALGLAVSSGAIEVYTDVLIWKVI